MNEGINERKDYWMNELMNEWMNEWKTFWMLEGTRGMEKKGIGINRAVSRSEWPTNQPTWPVIDVEGQPY